jgi:hypothetical protein
MASNVMIMFELDITLGQVPAALGRGVVPS